MSIPFAEHNTTFFLNDVLGQAAVGTGRYRGISAEDQRVARELLEEFRANPGNVSGTVIGVDLIEGIIRVSPWAR